MYKKKTVFEEILKEYTYILSLFIIAGFKTKKARLLDRRFALKTLQISRISHDDETIICSAAQQ